jgi:hypothetical protein
VFGLFEKEKSLARRFEGKLWKKFGWSYLCFVMVTCWDSIEMVSRQVDGVSGFIFGHNYFHLTCYMVVHKDISACLHGMGDPDPFKRMASWFHSRSMSTTGFP